MKKYIKAIIISLVIIIPTFSYLFITLNDRKAEPINSIEENKENFNLIYYQEKYNNDEIVARLEIPNLFNILITKTNDNEYYLNHSINKDKDIKGTEFMDYRTDLNSKQINIYGHNSKTYNIPFRKLESFLDKDFFEENKYIYLEDNEKKSTYQILLIKEILNDYEHMKVEINENNVLEHLHKLEENTIHKRNLKYNEESKILILQTCSYNQKDSFYIIVAIRED